MRKDEEYRKVFDGEWRPAMHLEASLEIVRAGRKRQSGERGESLQIVEQ